MTANGYSGENILKLIVVMVELLCKYAKIYWIVHFKWVNSMICELYVNKTDKNKKTMKFSPALVLLSLLKISIPVFICFSVDAEGF